MLKFVPRDYQVKAVASVHERLAEFDSTLVVMPTGTGKTVVAGSICDDYVKAARRVMFIAHREELVEQAANSIRSMTGLDVRMEMANHSADEHSMFKADVVVASVQTLTASKCRRLHQFEARGFGALIIDEAHHAVAKTYLKVIDWAREKHVKVVGITATPDRGDEAALGRVFDEPAFVYEILDAIKDGWLVPVDCEYVHVDGYDISTVKTVDGDLNQGQLAAELEREPIVCKMAASMVEDSQSRPTIGFYVTVKQAELGCHAVNGMEPGSARWVCGETPSFERRPIMQGFKAGAFRHLMNVGIATEGFDAPVAACCAMGRPTKSRALYAQCLGRITRPLPGIVDDPSLDAAGRRRAIAASGKPNGLVLDYVGNSGNHKLVTPADVLGGNYDDDVVEEAGKRLKAKKGGGPEDIVAALEAAKASKLAREQEKVRIASQRTRTRVDLFDALDIRVPCERGWHRSKQVTPRMRDLLERNGFKDIDKLSYVKASAICGTIVERIKKRQASPKQVSALLKAGMPAERARGMTFRDASDAIGKISANGWRMPAGMVQ